MKKFYLCSGNIPKGPFKLEELIQYGIKKTDLIWCEGFRNCKLAIDIAELKKFFVPAPGEESAAAKPVATGLSYDISHELKTIYSEKDPNSKYITLFKWSVFVVFILILYYCTIEFL